MKRETKNPPKVGISTEQRVRLFLLALVSRVMAPSRNSRVHIGFLTALQDLRAVSSLNWGGMAYGQLLYEIKWASPTAPEGEPSIAALWSVLEIWMYKHYPTLASDRTRDAAYPYAASWIRAVCRRVPLSASRIAWRVLPVSEVIWRPFADAPIHVSAARAHFLSLRRVWLPGVYHHMWYLGKRVSLQHSTGDRLVPKDPPRSMSVPGDELAQLYLTARGDAVCLPWENFVDRRGRFEDLLGRLAPPVRFVLPKRRRGRRGSVDREPQAETSLRQEGPSLDLRQGSRAGTFQRHSDADRGAAPFVNADPTRHSFGGASSSRPFVPPPGYNFGGSGPQP
ncbi:uncharacterized protein [Spinacia oleracea]|uniref:Aminotransferase-like plant mobile domain-containing protein n=1 Tax=Spinacia oleracea TaxID=3562 RepID=A0ABM3RQR4_SPIOL|nr:uncharacterized protein LOC130471716 [Spinacia oleracea]